MSGDYNEQTPSSPGAYRTADEIVRSILDSDASPSDYSPSGELYRAIDRYTLNNPRPPSNARPNLVRNHLSRLGQRPSSGNSMPAEPSAEAQRRFSREPQSSDTSPLYNLPPVGPYLPPLRSLASTRRPSAMSLSGGSDRRHHAREPPHISRLRRMAEI